MSAQMPETFIGNFKVDQLKIILRQHNLRVGGSKITLVDRILSEIKTCDGMPRASAIRSSIVDELGWAPGGWTPSTTTLTQNRPSSQSQNQPQIQLQSHKTQPLPQAHPRMQYDHVSWAPLPFIDVVSRISPNKLLHSAAGRQYALATMRWDFVLPVDVVMKLREAKNVDFEYQVFLFMGKIEPTCRIDVVPYEWPAPEHLNILINGSQIPSENLRKVQPMRKKPWSAMPLNLTPFVNTMLNVNSIEVRWSSFNDMKFLASIQLVKKHSVEYIVSCLRKNKSVSKEAILAQRHANLKEDDDIEATEQTISLIDPTLICRITIPARGRMCRHMQCFEASSFYQLMMSGPSRHCPVCHRLLPWDEIIVDGYFAEVLKATSDDVESIIIKPNGEWTLPTSKDDFKRSVSPTPRHSNQSSSSAKVDDSGDIEVIDLDDDDISVVQTNSGSTHQQALDHQQNSSKQSYQNMRKSKVVEVIDLTLDSEDETAPASRTPPAPTVPADAHFTTPSLAVGVGTTSTSDPNASPAAAAVDQEPLVDPMSLNPYIMTNPSPPHLPYLQNFNNLLQSGSNHAFYAANQLFARPPQHFQQPIHPHASLHISSVPYYPSIPSYHSMIPPPPQPPAPSASTFAHSTLLTTQPVQESYTKPPSTSVTITIPSRFTGMRLFKPTVNDNGRGAALRDGSSNSVFLPKLKRSNDNLNLQDESDNREHAINEGLARGNAEKDDLGVQDSREVSPQSALLPTVRKRRFNMIVRDESEEKDQTGDAADNGQGEEVNVPPNGSSAQEVLPKLQLRKYRVNMVVRDESDDNEDSPADEDARHTRKRQRGSDDHTNC